MSDLANITIIPQPTEFLKDIQDYCRGLGWDDLSDPSRVLGAIVEFLLEQGEEPTYLSIVSRFGFVRAETAAEIVKDPEGWKKTLLGDSE